MRGSHARPRLATLTPPPGYGGTTQRAVSVEEKIAKHAGASPEELQVVAEREVVVTFNADTSDGLPWRFVPSQHKVVVHPGETTLAFYTATNLSDQPVTGVSTYNVAPARAGLYFNKIQCFCFEEQRLLPGETLDMPVFFYIDPEFATDPKLATCSQLTLSYTFFKVKEDEEEEPTVLVAPPAAVGHSPAGPAAVAAPTAA